MVHLLLDDAFMNFLRDVKKDEGENLELNPNPSLLRKISSSLVHIFKSHLHVDRITIPLMKTLQIVLTDGVFSSLQPPRYQSPPPGYPPACAFSIIMCSFSWSKNILILCKVETDKTKDVTKLIAAVRVYVSLNMFCADPQPFLALRSKLTKPG